MPVEVKRKEGQTIGALLYEFNKKIRQSGLLKEAKKRRFQARPVNRRKRKGAALYRAEKEKEILRQKKWGKA